MSSLIARFLAGAGMAAAAGGALLMHVRRRRRKSPPRRAAPPPPPVTQGTPPASDTDSAAQSPLLKPGMFTLSHFGLLVLLLTMMGVGLAFRGIERYPQPTTFHVNGGVPERGREAMMRYGCGGCHTIPGIRGATGTVGPSLDGFARRMFIGGQLPNTPDHLVAWLQDPRRYAPGTAMPDLGVTEPEARDMAAYFFDR